MLLYDNSLATIQQAVESTKAELVAMSHLPLDAAGSKGHGYFLGEPSSSHILHGAVGFFGHCQRPAYKKRAQQCFKPQPPWWSKALLLHLAERDSQHKRTASV
jgi:hypothetical protein